METSVRRPTCAYLSPLAIAALLTIPGCDASTPPPKTDAKAPPAKTDAPAPTPPPKSDLPEGLVTEVPEIAPGYLAGYLPADKLPNFIKQLPPPPAPGSTTLANDEALSKAAFGLKGTPRWDLAIKDADLHFPEAAGGFSCALGVPINPTDTPHLYRLMLRSLMDAGSGGEGAKVEYKRERPFMVHKETTCTPADEEAMRKDGSYPSGHTAIGWGWALVLSEVAPDRVDDLILRGRAFGESRMICNAHWQADVLQGRNMATAAIAILHNDPAFRADVEMAKRDVAAAKAKNLPPSRDCAAEAAALAIKIPGVL